MSGALRRGRGASDCCELRVLPRPAPVGEKKGQGGRDSRNAHARCRRATRSRLSICNQIEAIQIEAICTFKGRERFAETVLNAPKHGRLRQEWEGNVLF